MNIVVGKIQSAKEEGTHKKSFYKDGKKSSFKERRKNKQDRRKSVREGVIVSLSFKDDRRVLPDRRKANSQKNPYTI
jgi:HEAT repeat protein